MNEVYIRAILLIVVGSICTGASVGLKFAGTVNAWSVMLLLALVAFVVAIWVLLFAGVEE